jgi:hypothetical protein
MKKGRNAWDGAKFQEVLKRAGKSVECSWGVAGIRDRKTGHMQTVLMFNDDDKNSFAYAFGFSTEEEVAVLCVDLMKMAVKISKGEFDGRNN